VAGVSVAGNSGAQVRSGIHKSGDRGNREHPNDLGTHSPVVGRPDNRRLEIYKPGNRNPDSRNPDIRRRGSRSRCRVAVEV
jgi:hypothetical protein